MQLNQIVLFSHDINKLSNYLSDLFDLEKECHTDSVTIYGEHLRFLIVPTSQNLEFSNVLIDIKAANDTELFEIKQKIEFLNYRIEPSVDGKVHQTLTFSEIKEIPNSKFFFFTDTDGRKWKVSSTISI